MQAKNEARNNESNKSLQMLWNGNDGEGGSRPHQAELDRGAAALGGVGGAQLLGPLSGLVFVLSGHVDGHAWFPSAVRQRPPPTSRGGRHHLHSRSRGEGVRQTRE